ncbi:MAG: alpha/beta hydrolase [Halioglobus sp.]
MPEQYVSSNRVRLAYESFGNPNHPAIVLVMGLGTQLLGWPVPMCQALADQGFHVIRFDNRDVGLSEKMENAHIPQPVSLMLRSRFKLPMQVPYTLDDMALDLIGLLDALHIEHAHVVGASMGGMIAQIAAAKHGHRFLSLTSIMSSSGDPKLPGARRDVINTMIKRSLGMEKPNLENTMAYWRKIGSPGYQPSDETLKKKIIDGYNRSFHPEGYSRHLAAVIANGSRVRLLKTITTPTLVIHGQDDSLVPVECGIDTARHISHATLKLFPGMGHDLPEPLLPEFVALISQHAKAAQAAPAGSYANG